MSEMTPGKKPQPVSRHIEENCMSTYFLFKERSTELTSNHVLCDVHI